MHSTCCRSGEVCPGTQRGHREGKSKREGCVSTDCTSECLCAACFSRVFLLEVLSSCLQLVSLLWKSRQVET